MGFFIQFPFLIANMCFYTGLPHHFITINADLASAVVTFPSLSGLDRLFPHHCTVFIFIFFCHWPVPFPSKGTSLEQLYYTL